MNIVGHIDFSNNSEPMQVQFSEPLCYGFEEEHYFIICIGVPGVDIKFLKRLAHKILKGSFFNNRDEIDCGIIFLDKLHRKCFLMTDPHGYYPIYYVENKGVLHFSNKQHLLMQRIPVFGRLNEQVFFELFHIGVVTPPDTLIKNLYSIPATQYLKFQSKAQLNPFFYSIPSHQEYSVSDHLQKLTQSIEVIRSSQAHLLCSGGLDSILLAAVCSKILKKDLNLYTVSLGKNSLEYQKTQFLRQNLESKNYYFYPESEIIFENIDASILVGESEVVGALSMNAALEYFFAKFYMRYTFSVMTGDDNFITPAKVEEQSPGYYHLKYGLLLPHQSRQILLNDSSSMLAFVDKSKGYFLTQDKYIYFKSQRILIHSMMLGKIIGKYRLGQDVRQQCYMPYNAKFYRDYIDSVNYSSGLNFNYRQALQTLLLEYQLVSDMSLTQSKQWMPSVWDSSKSNIFLQEMYNQVLNDPMIQEHFHTQKLSAMLRFEKTYRKPLLLALYYLIRFKQLKRLG